MTETWNVDIPVLTNGVSDDISDIEENFDYLIHRFGYLVDKDEADQGAAGSGDSLKDLVDAIGSTKTATIYFPHHMKDGNTTTYTLSTAITISSNITLRFQNGARIQPDAGITLTIYSPANIQAASNQQIFSGDGSVAFSSTGKAFDGWFLTLEKFQESDAGHFIIANDWSISTTVDFDKNNSIIEFDGDATVTTTVDTVNGITISGNNCSVYYPRLTGPGTFHQDGTGGDLIKVEGDDCKIINGVFTNPPGSAISLNSSDRSKVTGNTIIGGPTSFTASEHYGIVSTDCDYLEITGNVIKDSVSGGRVCQGINPASGSSFFIISENHILGCWDEAIYASSGEGNIIDANYILDPGQRLVG